MSEAPESEPQNRTAQPTLAEYWRASGLHARFETVVSLVIVTVLSLLILILTAQLIFAVVAIFPASLEGLAIVDVQAVFGLVLSVLIALEFGRSITESLTTSRVIMQTRAIILIAVLTVVRKLMLIDMSDVSLQRLLAPPRQDSRRRRRLRKVPAPSPLRRRSGAAGRTGRATPSKAKRGTS